MIPELGRNQKDRADLTAIRYAASVCSSVMVYLITWIVLHNSGHMHNNIGPEDKITFRNICLIITGIGALLSVLFHVSLSCFNQTRRFHSHEHKYAPLENGKDPNADLMPSPTEIMKEPVAKKSLLRSSLLYQIALMYVSSRLFVTLSLVYMPLWLDERETASNRASNATTSSDLNEPHSEGVEEIALVPLVSFIASFFSSLLLKSTNQQFSSKLAYFVGLLICLCGCCWVMLVSALDDSAHLYGIAVLFGSGSSITMVSSLCLTAELAGSNNGGFIYSAVTFADKLISGLMVIIIENVKCLSQEMCPNYYRSVLAYVCGGATILGLLTLVSLRCKIFSHVVR